MTREEIQQKWRSLTEEEKLGYREKSNQDKKMTAMRRKESQRRHEEYATHAAARNPFTPVLSAPVKKDVFAYDQNRLPNITRMPESSNIFRPEPQSMEYYLPPILDYPGDDDKRIDYNDARIGERYSLVDYDLDFDVFPTL